MPENAVRNMDMTGYVSAIGGPVILDAMTDSTEFEPIDVSYFFGNEAVNANVNPIMYPAKEIIERCAMMHDTDTDTLLRMWSRVKGSNASSWTYILICLVLGGLIFAVIMKYYKTSSRHKKYTKKRK